jgi:hypothetical protein
VIKMAKVGQMVGAKRWGWSHAHPSAWMKPWKGKVLARDDPRAWENTLAFPGRRPTKREVKKHLNELKKMGHKLGSDSTPVLWDFGKDGRKVYWENTKKLRPYQKDLEMWKKARTRARKRR